MSIDFIPPHNLWFPDPNEADADGLLAFGGDLSVQRLVESYARGIFPWYGPGDPILWWSPDPRLVLEPEDLHVSRSLRRVINSRRFEISVDTGFRSVICECSRAPRREGPGTWLVPEMISAYVDLHHSGWAHSVEARLDGQLVGGVYGVAVGRAFFGESMFYREADASKVAFVWLVRLLEQWGYGLIDCQQTTAHLLRFGANEIPRRSFLSRIASLVTVPVLDGAWTIPAGFDPL
ncbi:leucyl/phenylalanyl-tRNA--protein transferase [Desulfovibrio ferrophilus]|uniref:Leucyl/phenylalanyl-tRNA--protein transferase n=1 Tax=Desulfovibrio ferrophilus TaxID=241368 RepID=A0A2Z6AWF1_9BACT|nr:leucyl/phenylalanyl-tRNA--protein transferase [Desulfovibrio ferrophilus]BBD07506.1 leucyl/phenylalanyl-tRNA/protein transferase [Desulfovibrio ferrophilus]